MLCNQVWMCACMYMCSIIVNTLIVCHNILCIDSILSLLLNRRRYEQVEEIRKGLCLQKSVVLYTYSSGNSCGNLYFIWTVPEDESESDLLTQRQGIVRKVEIAIPTYHTCAMRKQFVHDFQLLVHIEPKVMREMYRCLTGDSSASNDLNEAIVDERIRIIQLQDPDILPDLRHLNKGRPEKDHIFWEACKNFIEECSTVDERRHGETTHLACAMSVRDLVNKVASM